MRNRALASLADADFELLRPHLRLVTLTRGERIRRQDEFVQTVYFPLEGMLSSIVNLTDGRSIEAAMTGREGMADISALGTSVAIGDLLVQGPGQALTIAAPDLLRAMGKSAAIAKMVCIATEISNAYSLQSLACANFHQLDARLARWILMARFHMERDTFYMTQEFMAAMLGVQRSSVNMIAADIQEAGLISYHRGEMEILDVAGLEGVACECYRHVMRRMNYPYSRNS